MDMPPHTIIGLGELLWDVFPDGRRTGGAPANVAYIANQLGALGLPASRVGLDADGDALLRALSDRGLSTDLIQRDATHPTGRVTVQLTQQGQPSYVIHERVAWEQLEPTSALLSACALADAICFGTLAQRSERSRGTIHHCLAAAGEQTLIVYDVNLRQHWFQADWIERSARAADVVKLNDEELPVLCRMFQTADDSAAALAQRLFDWGVETLVVTRGARGCTVLQPGWTVAAAADPVQVVDTVGAGDAFTAAFIVGRLRRWPLALCANFANRVGGLVASRAGAMPDIAVEAGELLRDADAGAHPAG